MSSLFSCELCGVERLLLVDSQPHVCDACGDVMFQNDDQTTPSTTTTTTTTATTTVQQHTSSNTTSSEEPETQDGAVFGDHEGLGQRLVSDWLPSMDTVTLQSLTRSSRLQQMAEMVRFGLMRRRTAARDTQNTASSSSTGAGVRSESSASNTTPPNTTPPPAASPTPAPDDPFDATKPASSSSAGDSPSSESASRDSEHKERSSAEEEKDSHSHPVIPSELAHGPLGAFLQHDALDGQIPYFVRSEEMEAQMRQLRQLMQQGVLAGGTSGLQDQVKASAHGFLRELQPVHACHRDFYVVQIRPAPLVCVNPTGPAQKTSGNRSQTTTSETSSDANETEPMADANESEASESGAGPTLTTATAAVDETKGSPHPSAVQAFVKSWSADSSLAWTGCVSTFGRQLAGCPHCPANAHTPCNAPPTPESLFGFEAVGVAPPVKDPQWTHTHAELQPQTPAANSSRTDRSDRKYCIGTSKSETTDASSDESKQVARSGSLETAVDASSVVHPWVAIAERGSVSFAEKAFNSYKSGAAGLVVIQNRDAPFPFVMRDSTGRLPQLMLEHATDQDIDSMQTPSFDQLAIMISHADGTQLRRYLAEAAELNASSDSGSALVVPRLQFVVQPLSFACSICLEEFLQANGDDSEEAESSGDDLLNPTVDAINTPLGTPNSDSKQDDAPAFQFPADSIVPLPCGHVFHGACLLEWLRKRSTCPLCRRQFPTRVEELQQARSGGTQMTSDHNHSLFR